MPIPKEKIKPDSIVYTDAFVSYNVLDVYKFRHYRINHNALFADGKSHINGIENFRTRRSVTCENLKAPPAPVFTCSCANVSGD
jgi:transposase-like protein